jgi:hypothetical protein
MNGEVKPGFPDAGFYEIGVYDPIETEFQVK